MSARPVYGTIEGLLDDLAGGRSWRLELVDKHVDSLSGSPFEFAVVGSERFLIKHIAHHLDWIMRDLDDGSDGREPRALIIWRAGILDALPAEIDHLTVGMAYDAASGLLRQVMRYEPAAMVPPGDSVIPLELHRRFLDHMAAMHVAFWGFRDTYGLTTAQRRYGFADPSFAAAEAAAGHTDRVPQMFPGGWERVATTHPEAVAVAMALIADPTPLALAMAEGPSTLVHGDWKFGNLGTLPDGRSVLIDWAWPGEAPCCVDLAWYLAVNCDRLPESKEDSCVAYRSCLERRGIPTAPWWDRQLELALLGGFLQLGWSKKGDELAWWAERSLQTARAL